ncbi:MAG: hypothetical protein ACTSVY_14800 [Candidatus Helarchaeota archaeon]
MTNSINVDVKKINKGGVRYIIRGLGYFGELREGSISVVPSGTIFRTSVRMLETIFLANFTFKSSITHQSPLM